MMTTHANEASHKMGKLRVGLGSTSRASVKKKKAPVGNTNEVKSSAVTPPAKAAANTGDRRAAHPPHIHRAARIRAPGTPCDTNASRKILCGDSWRKSGKARARATDSCGGNSMMNVSGP